VSSIAAQLVAALPAYRAAIEAEEAAGLRQLLEALEPRRGGVEGGGEPAAPFAPPSTNQPSAPIMGEKGFATCASSPSGPWWISGILAMAMLNNPEGLACPCQGGPLEPTQ
jgi:hypothetical protein